MRAELRLRLEFGLTGSPDNLLCCYGDKALNILVILLAVAWAAKRNRWTLTFNATLVRNLRVRLHLLPRLEQTQNDSKYHNKFQSLSTSRAWCGREKLVIAPWEERRSRCVGVWLDRMLKVTVRCALSVGVSGEVYTRASTTGSHEIFFHYCLPTQLSYFTVTEEHRVAAELEPTQFCCLVKVGDLADM